MFFKRLVSLFFIYLIFSFFSIRCFGMHEFFSYGDIEKSDKNDIFLNDLGSDFDENKSGIDLFDSIGLPLKNIKDNNLKREESLDFNFKLDSKNQFLQNKREKTINFKDDIKINSNLINSVEEIEKSEKEKLLELKEIRIENKEAFLDIIDSRYNLIKKQERVIEDQNKNFNKFFIEQLNLKKKELNKILNLKNEQKDILFLGYRYFFNSNNESFKDINKGLKTYYLELFKYMLEKDMINEKNHYPDDCKIYLKKFRSQFKNLNEFLDFYLSFKDDEDIFFMLRGFAKNFNNLKRRIKCMNLALKDLNFIKEMFLDSLAELDYYIKENCNEYYNEFINNFKENIKDTVIEKINKIKDENIYIYFEEIFNFIEAQKNSFLGDIKCYYVGYTTKIMLNLFNKLRDIFLIDKFKIYKNYYKDFLKSYFRYNKNILKLIDYLNLEEFKKIVSGMHNIFEIVNISGNKIKFNSNFKFLYTVKLELKNNVKNNEIVNFCNTELISFILYSLEKENLTYDVGIINNVYYYDEKENCYILKFNVLPFKEEVNLYGKIENILKNCINYFNEKNKNIVKSVGLDCVCDC